MKTTVSSVKSAVLKLVKSLSTAAVLQYMGFVLVSAVFWCFMRWVFVLIKEVRDFDF